jgi:hypothetical protein
VPTCQNESVLLVVLFSHAPTVAPTIAISTHLPLIWMQPFTRASGVALWHFVPEQYRVKPEVFMSHAWDGSVWDIRPPSDINGLWLDVLAINQHPVAAMSHNIGSEVYVDVDRIGVAVAKIGRTCVVVPGDRPLMPFSRSWCLYEISATAEGKVELRVGWTVWSLDAHISMRAAVDKCDVGSAAASSQDDKAKIDQLVGERFGSLDAASVALRKVILAGFASEAAAALVSLHQADYRDRLDAVEQRGGQAHTDPEIVAVWER